MSDGSTVFCPGCQRGYPAHRLSGGRTLHCACGTRVGQRLDSGIATSAGSPRFLADSMLGGLARWLRAMGYDTAWEAEIDDAGLVRRGVEEKRWILTRDRRLPAEWWTDNLVLLEADDPMEQLAEVHRRFGIDGSGAFTRCTRCNSPLRPAPAQRRATLPETVRGREVAECPSCLRLYWRGSHTGRMLEAIERAIGG